MSKKVTAQEVKKVAQLGRLGLSAEEIMSATQQLSGVLNHFSQIQKIKTDGVPTADDMTGLKNVTRDDTARPEELCTADELLKSAPETKNKQFKVKAVFE